MFGSLCGTPDVGGRDTLSVRQLVLQPLPPLSAGALNWRPSRMSALADLGQHLVGSIKVRVHVLHVVRVLEGVNDPHQLLGRGGVDLLAVLGYEGDLGRLVVESG